MTRAPSPLRRIKAAVRKITDHKDGETPLSETLRANGLRMRLSGSDILIEPFEMDKPIVVDTDGPGSSLGQKIEALADGTGQNT